MTVRGARPDTGDLLFGECIRLAAGAFVAVLRRPGVCRPTAGAVIASIPIGMLGLAVLLLVQRSRGGFAAAGLAVGMLGAGTALGMMFQGRLIDRFGQTPVLLAAAGAQFLGMTGLVVASHFATVPGMLVCAFLSGACEPQVNASLRALWPTLVPPRLLPMAMTLSSVLFEAPVLLGPLILTAILQVTGPAVAILLCAMLFAAGTVTLATSRASRAWRGTARRTDLAGALAGPGVRTALLAAAGNGVIVGVVQVSAAARFIGYAGLMYAAFSAGSLSGAVAFGTRLQGGRPAWRMAALTVLCAFSLAAASLTATPVAFAVSLLTLGACLGPAGVLGYSLVGRLAPPGHAVEAFTMITAAGLSTIAVGAAAAGIAADRFGSTDALLATAVGTLLLAPVLILRRRSLPR
ncbi:MFS transporter [Actinoplanes subtropicus]|uniref:MFS transporter n=1 Tax=Actinoplanes subtropicus TaxID=543632 RepID=UPI0014701C3E|nr:MFS transporter [Actinoplanes subtropicus]